MSNSLDVFPYKVLKESTGFKEKDDNSLSEEILKKSDKFTVEVNRLRYLCIVIYNQRRCQNLKQVPQNFMKVLNVKLKSQLMALIHFRILQVVYNTYEKSYNELLILNRNISVHQKHLHFLTTEVYKSVNNLNPQFMWNYFNISTLSYEPRKGNKVNLPETRTCRYGINSLLFRGALLWNNLPRNVKESHSVAEFKEKIKEIGNLTCSYAVCK